MRRRLDEHAFGVRFTPRKRGSIWSAVNIRRARELAAQGRMRPSGTSAFEKRTERRSRVYSYENRWITLSQAYTGIFRARAGAWAWFQAQPQWYRRTSACWVMEAKREETRRRRLATLIECSAAARTVPPLRKTLGQSAEASAQAAMMEQARSDQRQRAR